MGAEFDRILDKPYRGRSAPELSDLPAHALLGVSTSDAEKLTDAFGIRTIADLADNEYFWAAVAIRDAADPERPDPGPPPRWRGLFAQTPFDTFEARPDLFRVAFGPVFYRGRLDGTARMLVVGQDPSVNEILAQRVFVGQSGQRLQGFLAKLGVVSSYLMLNTFLFSIFGQFGGQSQALSNTDPILGHRNHLFDMAAESNPLRAVLTVGSAAREAIDRWPGIGSLPRAHILHPAFPDEAQLLDNWNHALAVLRPLVAPDDGESADADYGTQITTEEVLAIPRRDLPFGLPSWHGDGDHGKRVGDTVIEWRRQPIT